MPTLLMLKGLPASGKSTFAKALVNGDKAYTAVYGNNWKRINKDDLRNMLDNGKWSKSNEKEVLNMRDTLTKHFLEKNYNVVIDDTNFAPQHQAWAEATAFECQANFEIKDFTDVDVEECIRRDQNRQNYVGEKVIRTMYNTYLKPKPNVAKCEWNDDLPACIIVDIDGTLAHMTDRSPYDYTKVHTDVPDQAVVEIVRKYAHNNWIEDMPETYIVIVSGREDSCQEVTEQWLHDNHIPYNEIFMRKSKDNRDDRIVKKEIYETYIKPRYNVRFVLDDRDRVVAQWRELGLKCLQVEPGDF